MFKKSVRYWFIVVFFIGISATIISVKANPPDSIGIVYDDGTKQLDVTITHSNAGSSTHIIDQVTIKVNGSTVKTEFYASQPSVTFTYNYGNITANPGATIQVTAYCTISGPTSNSIVIPGGIPSNGNGDEDPNNTEPLITGYSEFLTIIAISIFISLLIYYKRIRKVKN